MSAASLAQALGKDASDLIETTDPAPAAGDLKNEVARFTTLDACVAEHNALDPLVGDGLLAIGYDNFLRDTCRLLEATQAKDARRCTPIEASALRTRCEAFVAMSSAKAEACPLDIPADRTRGRDATCVAMATRDPRLCVGEIASRRISCEALVTGDRTRCKSLANPNERRLCERDTERWKTMLDAPSSGLPALSARRVHLELHPLEGSRESTDAKLDDATDAERGLVLVKELATTRLRIGALLDLGAVPHLSGADVRMGMLLAAKDGSAEARIERFELEVPGGLTLVVPGTQSDLHAKLVKLDRVRGGDVQLELEGTIGTAPHAYRIKGTITTFVRDIVGGAPTR